jgi:hypothetical protein
VNLLNHKNVNNSFEKNQNFRCKCEDNIPKTIFPIFKQQCTLETKISKLMERKRLVISYLGLFYFNLKEQCLQFSTLKKSSTEYAINIIKHDRLKRRLEGIS